ncbi:MAG: hypothetical protein SF051_15325 [Elusimicrobiota bacterium]|nr:hypothetical protein [Elusimicrobiota bacterium]
MRKARGIALLLCLACPAAAQVGGEPELIPSFAPAKRAAKPAPAPRRPEPAPVEEAPAYEIIPPRKDDLMRVPKAEMIGRKQKPREIVRLRSWWWAAEGSMETRQSRSFPAVVTQGDVEPVYWLTYTQKFKPRNEFIVHSVEFAPLSWLSFEAQDGRSRSRGRWSGADELHAPQFDLFTWTATGATWVKPDHAEHFREVGELGGTARWSAANMNLRVLEQSLSTIDETEFGHSLDLILGYHRFFDRMRVTNGSVDLQTYQIYASPGLGPINDLDSTYEGRWQGGHIGLRDDVRLPLGFGFEGWMLWSPFMEFQGDGFDNRAAAAGTMSASYPNYEDRARGTAIHLNLAAAWRWSAVRLEAGWQRLYFYSRTGNRRLHRVGGTHDDRILDHAITERAGFFAGASVRF